MHASFDIHPELRSVKSHALPSNRWVLAAMQGLLRTYNRLHRRRFKQVATQTTIRGSDGCQVPIVIVRPGNAPPASPLPALLYFHGGAFVMEGAPAHFENAVRYARDANCVVVFVDYRLAPRYVFPAGFHDCHAALLWTLANATGLGVDPTRVAVGGDSAGGSLAAGIAQRAMQEDKLTLKGQLLIYPAVDLLCSRPSMSLYRDVPPFKNISAAGVAGVYLGRQPQRPLPRYASPIDGDLDGLPPAYVETPQFDPLHDQGVEYAAALRHHDVDVEWNDIAGAIHGFDIVAAASSPSQAAMTQRIRFLRRIFI
jgi:acetyl esterase